MKYLSSEQIIALATSTALKIANEYDEDEISILSDFFQLLSDMLNLFNDKANIKEILK